MERGSCLNLVVTGRFLKYNRCCHVQDKAWIRSTPMSISTTAAGLVAVLTGAGISAESGVPTFRGDGGLWRNYQAQDLATLRAFHSDPKLVWERALIHI